MRKLILYEDGSQAVIGNVVIERNASVADEIRLDTLPEADEEEIRKHRRTLKVQRDKQGRVEAVTIGRKRLNVYRPSK